MRNSIKSGCMDKFRMVDPWSIHSLDERKNGRLVGWNVNWENQSAKTKLWRFFPLKKKVLRGIFILYIFRLHINIHQL